MSHFKLHLYLLVLVSDHILYLFFFSTTLHVLCRTLYHHSQTLPPCQYFYNELIPDKYQYALKVLDNDLLSLGYFITCFTVRTVCQSTEYVPRREIKEDKNQPYIIKKSRIWLVHSARLMLQCKHTIWYRLIYVSFKIPMLKPSPPISNETVFEDKAFKEVVDLK